MVAKPTTDWEQTRRANLKALILDRVAERLERDSKMSNPKMELVNGVQVRAEYSNKHGGMMRMTVDHEGVECEVEIDYTIDDGGDEVNGHRGVVVDSVNVPKDQHAELIRSFIRKIQEQELNDDVERRLQG